MCNDVADRTKQVLSNKMSPATSFLAARNCPFEPIVSEFESERTWCMMPIAVASSLIACFLFKPAVYVARESCFRRVFTASGTDRSVKFG